MDALQAREVDELVLRVTREVPVVDIHTHLFDPAMADLLLSGIDDLLTYHYHVAELFAACPALDYDEFWRLPTPARADLVWRELFVERSPLSEVGRGIVDLLAALGLDPQAPDLAEARAWFAARSLAERVDTSFALAGVRQVVMTNDPLDPVERACWERGFARDPRFRAALRLDSALIGWPGPVSALRQLGVEVDPDLSVRTCDAVRDYLIAWCRRLAAAYMAISLPPEARHPDGDATMQLIARAVVPAARELGVPVALMIGVTRQANPRLRLAGDSVGPADVRSLERLADEFHDVTFLVTYLARENQHALCVAARKFKNVVPFGCWWFVNNSGLIREITEMRLDMLGTAFVPQHSDCRVLEQLAFKWRRSRDLIGDVLAARYADLAARGWDVTERRVTRDVTRLFDGGVLADV